MFTMLSKDFRAARPPDFNRHLSYSQLRVQGHLPWMDCIPFLVLPPSRFVSSDHGSFHRLNRQWSYLALFMDDCLHVFCLIWLTAWLLFSEMCLSLNGSIWYLTWMKSTLFSFVVGFHGDGFCTLVSQCVYEFGWWKRNLEEGEGDWEVDCAWRTGVKFWCGLLRSEEELKCRWKIGVLYCAPDGRNRRTGRLWGEGRFGRVRQRIVG